MDDKSPKPEDKVVVEIGRFRLTASGRFAIMVIAIPTAGVMALVAGHYYGLW
jgi:hypothetical protein